MFATGVIAGFAIIGARLLTVEQRLSFLELEMATSSSSNAAAKEGISTTHEESVDRDDALQTVPEEAPLEEAKPSSSEFLSDDEEEQPPPSSRS